MIANLQTFSYLVHSQSSVVEVGGASLKADLCHPIVNQQKIL